MITIIDYGAGNMYSIKNMITRLGHESIVSKDENKILKANMLILPGVGNFDYGMQNLELSRLINVLNESVLNNKTPILGICLGAQLMCRFSEEGEKRGLGWFDAEVIKFDKEKLLREQKIPHMGWNHVTQQIPSKIFKEFGDDMRFYFVHSYHFVTNDMNICLATTNYGYEFPSVLGKDNIYAVQFHPEKSHRYGLKLMENFIKYD